MTNLLILLTTLSLIFLALALIRFNFPRVILLLVFIRPFVEATFDLELLTLSNYTINPMSLWGGFSIFLSIGYWLVLKRNPFTYDITKWIAFFLLSLSTGLVTGIGLGAVINQTMKIMSWILLIPVVADILRQESKETLFNIMYMALALFLLSNIVLFMLTHYNTGYYGIGEFYGYFKGPFSFGYTVLFLLPFALYRTQNKNKEVFTWVMLILCFAFIAFTYVRTTWVALLVGAFAFCCLERTKAKQYLPAFLLVVCFLIGLNLFKVSLEPAFEARTSDFQEYLRSGNVLPIGSGRFAIWSARLTAFSQGTVLEQIFGRGFGVLEVMTSGEFGIELGGHNDYVDLLSGTGFASTLLFLVFQGHLLRDSYRLYRTTDRFMGQLGIVVMVTMVTIGLLSGIIYSQSCVYIAVIMGVVVHSAKQPMMTQAQPTWQAQMSRQRI